MLRVRPIQAIVALTLLFILAAASDLAAAKKQKNSNSKNQKAIQTAKANIAASIAALQQQNATAAKVRNEAEQKISRMQGKLNCAAAEFLIQKNAKDSAQQALDQVQAELAEAKRKVEDAQDRESEYVIAKDSYEGALAEFDQARARILNSPEYKQRVAAAQASVNAAEAISKAQRDALEGDAIYREALAEMIATKAVLSDITANLLAEDPNFQVAIDAFGKTANEVADTSNKIQNALLKKASAAVSLSQAQRVAADAVELIAKNNAAIAALKKTDAKLNRNPNAKKKSPSPGSGGTGAAKK